jgi:hypothetical protein
MNPEKRNAMRNFVIACLVAIVVATIGAVGLNFLQEPASVAFSTQAVRL